MKSPVFKTALMGLLAAVISLAAAWFYPWPETIVESDLVGKPLFEAYDASSVRSISIIKYDPDRNGLDRIELRRSGEKWLIPARQNFVANNATQLGLAVNSLNGNVLEQRSSYQEDHVEYGVVDPMEYESSTNRSSLGTKIILEDRNNRELASLIVGSSPRGEGDANHQKHFVRIPGQPNVYLIDIPADSLATEFTRWVSPNLLGLGSDLPIESITINNYRLKPNSLSEGKPEWNYELLFDVKHSNRVMRIPAGDDNELQETEITDEDIAPLRALGSFLGKIVFTDVQKKSSSAATILRKRKAEKKSELDSLKDFGFAVSNSKSDVAFGFQFRAVGGEIAIRTTDGVAVSILVGAIAKDGATENTADLTLNNYVMLYATVDESIFPIPEPPEKVDDAEAAEKSQKAYLRLVEARKEKIKSATQRASDLNQNYADWYYIVSETIINGLRPDLTIGTAAKKNPDP